MGVELKEKGLVEKVKLLMAVKGYKDKDRKVWSEGVDYVASHAEFDDRILLRVITKPRSKTGIIGKDFVNEMAKKLKDRDFNMGFLAGRRFSKAARDEMRKRDIKMISERFMPLLNPKRLFFAMQEYIDALCVSKCGFLPSKECECKGRDPSGHYSCKVRLINDNAVFHFERGWINLLERDFERLIAIRNEESLKQES